MADGDIPDPFPGGMIEMANVVAEQFKEFVRAGIPPQAAAVMIGTQLGVMYSGGQQGSDGT